VWITPLEGVPVNNIEKEQIIFVNGRPEYRGSDYTTRLGVDVSEHQLEVDWQKVKDSGVDYAIIRIGRRGYTEGGLFDDPRYGDNVSGARAAGLDVGVYFFSQAITVQEAIEEANFVIESLGGEQLDMPVFFDWEKIEDADYARTDKISSQTLTDCAVAFCKTVSAAGYDAGVYFNRHLGYYDYDISRLTDYTFWLALPGEYPDFYYKFDMWQYSFTSVVPGIGEETDMNMQFIPVATPEPSVIPETVEK